MLYYSVFQIVRDSKFHREVFSYLKNDPCENFITLTQSEHFICIFRFRT